MGRPGWKIAIIAARTSQPRPRIMHEEDFTESTSRPSKTKQKEAMHELRDLGEELVDLLVLTTGGTGPRLRDVTPEATLAVADKEMPGFGEQMRQISLRFVPTAILSRQVAVIRGRA
jgi:molybdopterin adenylyltransferase